jgi:hypothetical protein
VEKQEIDNQNRNELYLEPGGIVDPNFGLLLETSLRETILFFPEPHFQTACGKLSS